ncbi:MAG TPA: hypothetical protein VNP04_32590 [Alphaproteobacteria bacterium]|nr:hypothetical protein [Alphaproteobacteria bacterium]
MTREERSHIRQLVLECQRLLQDDFNQLLRLQGLLPDRRVNAPADGQEARARLDQALSREGRDYPTGRQRYLRHAAFTFLNRLLALRTTEAHGLLLETLTPRPEYGNRSRRERDLADAAPGLAVAPERLAHEALQRTFAEMAALIPLLFRAEDPHAVLWPRLPAYRQLRERLQALPGHLWATFETLGWAYQYFNSDERDEIRRRLRRNPRPDDIPPLNQFYTVDWIVKALVHSTVGRLWLEGHPTSGVKDSLDYLVPIRNAYRPPAGTSSVRNFRILDPACGSGHFLLGAFDVLLDLWREERPNLPGWRIPALILERNLFGVDVDLRACQIAATALYLKARTTFDRLKGQAPEARFAPRRINIVCADVRVTDGRCRDSFLAEFAHDPEVQPTLEETRTAMQRAFEIGSLLRIREPFEKLFAPRTGWVEELQRKGLQLALIPLDAEQLSLGDAPSPVPKPLMVEAMVSGIGQFVRQASQAQDMGSQLFGMAAEQAVHLVDVLTETYDVVLMNPPYEAMPPACKEYAREWYPRTHNDDYAAFSEQAISVCKPGGYVGALTGRTFPFPRSFQRLREGILRHEALPELVLDLAFNVLDEATARYAAFTLRRRHPEDGVTWAEHPATFFRLTDWDWEDKRERFEEALFTMNSVNKR